MSNDRLRNDNDNIENLEDIIDARSERTTYAADDIDSFEEDIEIPEEIDVDEALTFPHPKHKHSEDIDLMDTPHKEDSDQSWEWSNQDMQPTDYEQDYNQAESVFPNDDDEMEERVHELGVVSQDELVDGQPMEVMPNKFQPDEETPE